MPLMGTCLGRLGSRYSIIFDPHRREIQYGALGLMRQEKAEMVIGIDDTAGNFCALPLCKQGKDFLIVDQRQTMTSLFYEAWSVDHGAKLTVQIVAPFWPQNELASTVPAFILKFRLERMASVRWYRCKPDLRRKGVLRFGLVLPTAETKAENGRVSLTYKVSTGQQIKTGEGGLELDYSPLTRRVRTEGQATDVLLPLKGFVANGAMLEVEYDLDANEVVEAEATLASYCGDALMERFGQPMTLKYARTWTGVDEVVAYVSKNCGKLCQKSAAFDDVWLGSPLPMAAQDLSALSFQSYLMCTLWCAGAEGREWFSVWEGSCWFNSTVDVTYNEAMFYFSCWPQLLETIFEEWSHHANDAKDDRARRKVLSDDDRFVAAEGEFDFPGRIMQHDMGAGWTANGMSYHHMMPVEENSNWLLLLYAHGRWWGREALYKKYGQLNKDLADYLLWADASGNGFPSRGTANTIDDATPAVQYGRDNVYLGVKRLAALHAARRMFEATGEKEYAAKCAKEVAKAVKTLNKGWLGDHWGVCLDKSAKGIIDCWTKKPLPFKTLPGWDAYSLYTTNGLLYLMMVDDLPPGISAQRLRQDVANAAHASMTRYGCGHSSLDKKNMWVSMNVWRDCAAAYLGIGMIENCERYWAQQVFANGPGAEKVNCFTETSLTNNLVWYPRNTAIFGLLMAVARLVISRDRKKAVRVSPIMPGKWPLLPLADWKKGRIPTAQN